MGAQALGFEFSGFRHLPPVRVGRGSHFGEAIRWATEPVSKTGELRPCEFDSRPLRIGSASRLATAAGLNPVELRPWAFDSPRFRSMAATQPVDGAALIRRYCSVRVLPEAHAASATGKRGPLLRERFRVRVSGGVRTALSATG